jgi:hypothetical protein
MISRLPRVGLQLNRQTRVQVRFTSGIKLLNEKAKAEEDYYFSKQDGMIRSNLQFLIIS